MVDYELPPASKQLEGKTVQLRVEDKRETKVIMTQNARQQFKSFNDRYSLAWIKPNTERVLAGEYDLKRLLKTAFEKRLNLMGANIVTERISQEPLLEVTLESFSIDYKGRKWLANVGYRASLTKQGGHPVTSERIRGTAERIRIIGRKGADMVVSDIFTDAINRLDISKLFKNARLIP
jgi:ABC-type uncharacterized transport system auxiliary subunit